MSDCVGVHVAGVGVIRARSSASNILDTASTNLTSTNLTSTAYLNTWARYQLDGYCLAVLFSSKVRHVCSLELQTRVREDFTIMEKSHRVKTLTRAPKH